MDALLTRGVGKLIPRELAEAKIASGKKMRVYLGIDPTGAKLHLGHAVPLRKLKAFADAGHHVIFLVGSFTAMIGDPSGRDDQRQSLTRKQVEENFQTYKDQASKILDFSKIEIRYNHEWLQKLTQEELLKIASYFTKQQMDQRDMFERREREGNPIHLQEMLYPLYVGYDSVILDVDCELGGTDQEFNMLAGRTLQKAFKKREKFILTTPLIEGTDGRKMSKTYNNCIYLTDEPNDMYGKLMSLKDTLMKTYFECCTDVPVHQYQEVLKGNLRDAKAHLAHEIVTLYHGKAAADNAKKEFENVFQKRDLPADVPEVKVKKGSLLIDVVVEQGLVSSKSEARRLVSQKGIHMNDRVVDSTETKAEKGIVKIGKRKFLKIL
ncbi:tyrosine--tRNA ligase [Candidatus Peregrinibacteria bacterium]|nr:tyrosine--tRNA ligase [Candidatus Peregrinibacteria bacterium]